MRHRTDNRSKCWFIITTSIESFKQKLTTNFLKLIHDMIKKLKKKVNQQTFSL